MTEPAAVAPADALAADRDARARALRPDASFIVQAPAGSGKTTLLVQRLLALLATVDAPEEIVAITFTRKAAAEMRRRVIDALRAAGPVPAASTAERRTAELAAAARARDAALGWGLVDAPGRLRIQTIDALCAMLARRLPWTARLGGAPRTIEDASALYRAAARATLDLIDGADPAQAAVAEHLLQHLDNDVATAEGLLVLMLARRDQWLRRLGGGTARERALLEDAWRAERAAGFARAAACLAAADAAAAAGLVRAAGWAGANLAPDSDSPLRACDGLDGRAPAAADEAAWLGLAALALTGKGEWRRRLDRGLGFPPPSDVPGSQPALRAARQAAKDQCLAALAVLQADEPLRQALEALPRLPPPRYTDAQWDALGAILGALRLAVAQLLLEFHDRGVVDFTAIADAALRALGERDAPTDLMLALDARLRHLLVDEFQDTSVSQFELLERLVAGWQPGDGRTLFLVGDPMQSIYRFRAAEVGLFLRARHEGLGGVTLQPLTLSVNFRSSPTIVAWVNETFAQVFPAREDIAQGAVALVRASADPDRSAALRAAPPEAHPVRIHPLIGAAGATRQREAACVVALVRAARAARPDGSIAVLVRARNHLAAILPALRAAGIPYQAVEIDRLASQPAVADVHALTRALSHPADLVAWLALLRAPCCGLDLPELLALAGARSGAALWSVIADRARWPALDGTARRRLDRLAEALRPALAARGRAPLRERVERAWLALGGPATVADARGLADVDSYLDCLEQSERAGELPDMALFEEAMQRLFAAPSPHDDAVRILTLHKAKGLEFDTVILAGLGQRPRSAERALLLLDEQPRAGDTTATLIAPLQATGAAPDAAQQYLARRADERAALESARLLYVGATRARLALHLIGAVEIDAQAGGAVPRPPERRSLLWHLWPVLAADFAAAAGAPAAAAALPAPGTPPERAADAPARRRRLVADWQLPPLGPDVAFERDLPPAAAAPPIEFSWAGETARHIGTVVHRALRRLAEDALRGWDAARVAASAPQFRRDLERLGVPPDRVAAAVERACAAVAGALDDPRGRWLLGPQRAARCEWRLTGVVGQRLVDVAIDRSFVDDRGVRWIVDYKTGPHEGGAVDAFLDREVERYRAQLERYAGLLRALEGDAGAPPLRCALYFPLLGGWREWAAATGPSE